MKFLVVILAVVASAAAEEVKYDFANAKPIADFPFFQEKFPQLKSFSRGGSGGRIVGGEIATPGQFPYQGALLISVPGGTALCGGSLISADAFVTAAHCVDTATEVQVILGAQDRTIVEPEQVRVTVGAAGIFVHEGWLSLLIRNDVALIRFPSPVTFTARIQPVALPTRTLANELFNGVNAVASGFGRFADSIQGSSPILRFVELPVITNLLCTLSFPGIVQPSNICTSGANGRGTCQGDSGGPLTIPNPSTAANAPRTLLIGITSFGAAAGCEPNTPAAFARVSSFLDWISERSGVAILP